MAGNSALRKYRTDRGLTQEALAKELGVSGITVSRWETGARQIDRDLVSDISRKTRIPPRDLRPDLAELMGA
jgi:transcriptional regulator with XRE-family HTH domain